MKTNIKVAGTTFHPLPKEKGIDIEQELVKDNVPCAVAQALLLPEPTNQYDPEAVQVLVKLTDGTAFHIGYLPAKEPLKATIKVLTVATLLIKDYGQVGNYNPSFILTEIGG